MTERKLKLESLNYYNYFSFPNIPVYMNILFFYHADDSYTKQKAFPSKI